MSLPQPRNPFRINKPIEKPADFVGRGSLLGDLRKAMQSRQSIYLYGERGTGKTSLLQYLASQDVAVSLGRSETHIPVYINFQEFMQKSAIDIWKEISKAIAQSIIKRRSKGEELAKEFRAKVDNFLTETAELEFFIIGLEYAFDYLNKNDLTIYLLCDNIDQTFNNRSSNQAFYNSLHSLPSQTANVSYIAAARMYPPDFQKHTGIPTVDIPNTVTLGPFHKEEVYTLIFDYFARAGFDMEIAQKLCDASGFLYTMTGYYPALLQILCYHLCERLDLPDWPEGQAQHEALYAFERDAAEFFRHYWDSSDDLERSLLRRLAVREQVDWSEPRIGAIIRKLENRCLILRVEPSNSGESVPDEGYQLFSSAFGKWISAYERIVWKDDNSISAALNLTRYYVQESSKHPVQMVLKGYVKDYYQLVGRSQIELHLARRLLNDSFDHQEIITLPDEILKRTSGSLLQWVINQKRQSHEDLPGLLAQFPILLREEAMIFAYAWLLWANNPVLQDSQKQEDIVQWIKPVRQVLGWVALALAQAGNIILAQECYKVWLCGGVMRTTLDSLPEKRTLLDLIRQLLPYNELQEQHSQAILQMVISYRNDQQRLSEACQLAFEHHYYQEALTAADILLTRPQADQPGNEWYAWTAIRIAALVQMNLTNTAIEQYCQHWYEMDAPIRFPHPHILLLVLDTPELAPIRHHLLNHCRVDGDVPDWVQLEQRDMQNPSGATLSEWLNAFNMLWKNISQEIQVQEANTISTLPHLVRANRELKYILFRLTETCIAVGTASEPVDRQHTRQYWASLTQESNQSPVANQDSLVHIAHSVLVLLEPDLKKRIQRYESYLADVQPGSHWFMPQATRRHVEDWLELHAWHRAFVEVERVEKASSPIKVYTREEYAFFHQLSRIHNRFMQEQPRDDEQWEELLCKPLKDYQVRAVLAYFLETRNQSRVNLRMSEMELHLTRCTKALGERWLRKSLIAPADSTRLAEALRETDLSRLQNVLSDIESKIQEKAVV